MEKRSPKIIVLAIGPQTTDTPPSPRAVGRRPAIVVSEVKTIGRKRVPAAVKIDSRTETPVPRNSFIKLIKTIASFTAIPAKATPAYNTVVENGVPETYK